MSNSRGPDYHDLLPLHHAMQLRRRMLAQSRGGSVSRPTTDDSIAAYDGTADQKMIMDHLDLVTPLEAVLGHLYTALFRRAPHARSMFPDSLDFQRGRLSRSLLYLVENLHRPDVVIPAFEKLGSEHRKLGVRAAHYPTFKLALSDALRAHCGPQLPPEVESAWLRVLQYAIDIMQRGFDADITAPPYWRGDVILHELRRPDLAVIRVVASEPYEFVPGQHGTLQTPLLPRAWRPYGIACAPNQENVLEYHIRQTGTDGVSEALVHGTAVGDTLRLGPAAGVMTLREDLPDRDLLLVASDTGLAPLKSMLEVLTRRQEGNRRIHLFVAARSRAELYDWPALSAMADRFRGLALVPVISGQGGSGGAEQLADALGRYGDWSQHVAFISGPSNVVGVTVNKLMQMGVPGTQIRYEPAVRQNEM